jgi:hypothetical protein
MRDMRSDWNRWSLAERIAAMAIGIVIAASASSLIGLSIGI